LFRPYVQAVRAPGALPPLAASFVGGLPIGMLTLAVLLLVRLQSGSFLGAGVMAAALNAGNAAGVAVQGALIDRRGQTVVLVPASLICLSSLVALVLVAGHSGQPALTACLAAAGGAAIPATPSSMRTLWPALIAEPRLRVSAYALSAASFTAATVLGPALVSALLLAGGPQAAVLAAAGLAGVAVPAAAIALGTAALAGVFGATAAAGDLCGGLIYGSARWRLPPAGRLVAAQFGSAVIGACLALASWSIPAMMLVLPVSGAAGAVQGITTTTVLDDVAEPGMLTGSYALLVSCGLAGSAAGYAAGGAVIAAAGIRGSLLAAAAAGLAGAAWYARRTRTLKPGPDPR
jgi:hypothetical protein